MISDIVRLHGADYERERFAKKLESSEFSLASLQVILLLLLLLLLLSLFFTIDFFRALLHFFFRCCC